jgi:hypothetical protein
MMMRPDSNTSNDLSPLSLTTTTTTTTTTTMMMMMMNDEVTSNSNSSFRFDTPNGPMTMSINENDLRLLSTTIEHVLDNVDKTLTGLEIDRDLLPTAIIRKCNEFADGIGSLADELENQSIEERKQLADVIRDDLLLYENNVNAAIENNNNNFNAASIMNIPSSPINGNNNNNNNNDDDNILQALSGASTILRDVENALREIKNDEAEEIADAALIVARLFLLSLQSIHDNISMSLTTNNSTTGGNDDDECNNNIMNNNNGRTTVIIEELSSDDDDDESNNNDDGNKKEQLPSKDRSRRQQRKQQRRMRVLWPPLGPHVDKAMSWTKEETTKRPLLAVALGLTLWPVTISTALIGSSVCLVDGAVQDVYEKFRDTPLIDAVEQSAAQAYQAGRLTLATSKLVGKQTLRVLGRQINRRGGIGPIVEDIGSIALDRITHPIDTIGKVWDGCIWSLDVIKNTTEQFVSMRHKEQESLVQ